MANYTKTTIGKENRIELHEKLSLTGASQFFKQFDYLLIIFFMQAQSFVKFPYPP